MAIKMRCNLCNELKEGNTYNLAPEISSYEMSICEDCNTLLEDVKSGHASSREILKYVDHRNEKISLFIDFKQYPIRMPRSESRRNI